MRKIKVGKTFATVDNSDYKKLLCFSWYLKYGGWNQYAITDIKGDPVAMHRLIMNTPKGMDTDHINGNGLDNRRGNLRICSHAENMRNSRHRKNATNAYKGITKCAWVKKKMFRVKLKMNSKHYHIGYYATPQEAALAYNLAAKKLFGDFARLNTI